jgi:hypothetical protein
MKIVCTAHRLASGLPQTERGPGSKLIEQT